MEFNGSKLDSIVVTTNASGQLVTENGGKEVIAVIAEDKIITKDGYDVKLVPADDVNVAQDTKCGIFSGKYARITISSRKTGDELIVIEDGDTPFRIIDSDLIVKLTPCYG